MNASPLRSVWEMQELYMPVLIELAREIGRIVEALSDAAKDDLMDAKVQASNKSVMATHGDTFRQLGLRMCAKKVDHILEQLKSESVKISEFARALDDLYGRMEDECGLSYNLTLSASEAALFSPKEPLFGNEVAKKFPSASFEVEECGKCMALGRSTAAVFHTMRTMELGIRAVAACLSIPSPIKDSARNWGSINGQIKNEIDAITKSKTWKDKADKDFFDEIHVSLDAVRVAWRNTTMHVEKTYTGEEADHIFVAVRGFMKKLASRMDEQGLPNLQKSP